MLKLCIGTPITYSSAFCKSAISESEIVNVSFCSGVRAFSGVYAAPTQDRKSTRLNSSHTVIYTLSLHDALPILLICLLQICNQRVRNRQRFLLLRCTSIFRCIRRTHPRSEEHTSELQSHSDLHSFPTRRSSDLTHLPSANLQSASPKSSTFPSAPVYEHFQVYTPHPP